MERRQKGEFFGKKMDYQMVLEYSYYICWLCDLWFYDLVHLSI